MRGSRERTSPQYYSPLPNPRDYIPYIYNEDGLHEETVIDEKGEEDLILTELLASEIGLALYYERETRRENRRERSRLKHGRPEKRNKRIGREHEEIHQYFDTVQLQRQQEKNKPPKKVAKPIQREQIWETKIGQSTVKTVGFSYNQL